VLIIPQKKNEAKKAKISSTQHATLKFVKKKKIINQNTP
jgi:hypothetical protein